MKLKAHLQDHSYNTSEYIHFSDSMNTCDPPSPIESDIQFDWCCKLGVTYLSLYHCCASLFFQLEKKHIACVQMEGQCWVTYFDWLLDIQYKNVCGWATPTNLTFSL